MNIVVIDKENLPEGVEFPFLQAPKYGWVERAGVTEEELAEVAWRAHVLVTANTPISSEVVEKLPLLKMVAIVGDCSGNSCNLVDMDALKAREIQLTHVLGGVIDSLAGAESCCAEVVRTIDAMIVGEPINLVVSG